MPNYGGYVVATIGGFDDEERDVPVGWCPTLDQAERIAAELDRRWTSDRVPTGAREARKSGKSRATKAASKPRPDLIASALHEVGVGGGHIVQGARDVIGVRAASVGFAGATEPLTDPAPWDRAIERADAGSDGSLDSILRAWFRRDYPSLPMPYSVRGEDQPSTLSEHRSLSRSDRQAMRDALAYGTGLGDLIRWHGTLTNAPTVQLSDRVAWIADRIGLIRESIGTVRLSELPKRHLQTTDPEAGKRLQVCRELLYLLAHVNLSDDAGIPEPLIERAEQLANGLRQYVGAIGAGRGGSQNVPTGGAGDDDQRRAVDPATPASVPLTSDHESILSVLAMTPMKCKQVNWVASKGTIRNRETVGRLLSELAGFGLVNRPHGKRKGYALTDAGRKWLPGASPT